MCLHARRGVCVCLGSAVPLTCIPVLLNHLMTPVQKPASRLTFYCDPINSRTCPVFEHACGHVFSMYHLQQETCKHTETQIPKLTQVENGARIKSCWCWRYKGLGTGSGEADWECLCFCHNVMNTQITLTFRRKSDLLKTLKKSVLHFILNTKVATFVT